MKAFVILIIVSMGLPSSVTLPVKVLPTSDGMSGKGMYAGRYSKSIRVAHVDSFANQIGAYGTAYGVWIAPKGWTGSGSVGVDGNTVAQLHPNKGSMKSGPHATFYIVPGCASCMLSEAAPYFPDAMRDWNDNFNEDGKYPIRVPRGLKIRKLSATLITYSLPDAHGLCTRGAVHYERNENLSEAKFVLPKEDNTLADFLVRTFISREELQ